MCSCLFCFSRISRKREVNKIKKKFLRRIKTANLDPLRDFKKQMIVSQIDRGSDLKILEMNDFTLKGSLGSGTASEVCLLVRKKDQREFAGKFIKREISASEFINEATILNSCSTTCATVVNLVGIMTTPQCMVLEYYVNGSLDVALLEDSKRIQRGMESEFPFLRKLGFIKDMCTAVNELHQKNICHRDIAMRNLLLSDDKEHVVLTDFSLSRIIGSGMETQSTLNALLPITSAPETLRKSNTIAYGRERFERYYSFKSDIWSLGITMFEIIDKELGDIKKLPSKFPTERLPSTKVFNRMLEFWVLILRCWDKKPERRPQSWEVQECIEGLIENPLDIGNEHEGYISRALSKGITSTWEEHTGPSPMSGTQVDCNWMSTGYQDELYLGIGSGSLMLFSEQESSESIMSALKSNLLKMSRMKLLGLGEKSQQRKRHNRSSLKRDFEKVSNEHLCLPISPIASKNTFARKRNSSNYSISSYEEPSLISERVAYCPPLNVSFKSEATNIKYCGDRHFFQNSANNLIEKEYLKTGEDLCTPVTPNTEPPSENPSGCVLVTAIGNTPHLGIRV